MDITTWEISSRLLNRRLEGVTASTYFKTNCDYQLFVQVPPLHSHQCHFRGFQPWAAPQTSLDRAKAISHLPGWYYGPPQERARREVICISQQFCTCINTAFSVYLTSMSNWRKKIISAFRTFQVRCLGKGVASLLGRCTLSERSPQGVLEHVKTAFFLQSFNET